jgi:hypothetical protein
MSRRRAGSRQSGDLLVLVGQDSLCWDCTREVRSEAPNANDFAGLCGRSDNIAVYCTGCGESIWVDHRGRRVGAREQSAASADRSRPIAV